MQMNSESRVGVKALPSAPQKGWKSLLLEESSANITSGKPRSRLSWKDWRLCQPRALFLPSVPPPIPASVPSLISSNSVSILVRNTTPWKEEESFKFLGDPKAVFVDSKILGESQMSQGRLGVKFQEVGREASYSGKFSFTSPGLQFSGEERRKEGCRGKAGVIRILPHAGAGSIFGGKNWKAEAPGLPLFPALLKCITKALKDVRRMGIPYNRVPHLDVKMGVASSPSPLLLLSEFLLRTLRVQNQKPSFIYQRGAGSPSSWVRLLPYAQNWQLWSLLGWKDHVHVP